MTIHDLILLLGENSRLLALVLAVPPLLTWLLGLIQPRGQGGRPPWQYLYAAVAFLVCTSGTLALALTAYSAGVLGQSLLEVNFFVYLMPIVSMVLTLGLMRQRVDFAEVPGLDRFVGLGTLALVTVAVIVLIAKTRLHVVFLGSTGALVLFALFLFAFLKWGSHRLFRRQDEARRAPPSLTDFLTGRGNGPLSPP